MQYDVYPNPSPRLRDVYPCAVDVQSDLLKALVTRMAAPLATTALPLGRVPRRLCPMLAVGEQTLMRLPSEAAPLDICFKFQIERSTHRQRTLGEEVGCRNSSAVVACPANAHSLATQSICAPKAKRIYPPIALSS
jgi:hypothetical protein